MTFNIVPELEQQRVRHRLCIRIIYLYREYHVQGWARMSFLYIPFSMTSHIFKHFPDFSGHVSYSNFMTVCTNPDSMHCVQ